jgi:peptidoglycan/LPS O-acetylase OafA/YrhL
VAEKRRIPELDGIRGLAITMVILYHYIFYRISAPPKSLEAYALAAGRLSWTGVDLFFVLSGFLIGGILLDSRNSPTYFQTFYRHRFFRIVPLYAVVLFATATVLFFHGARFSLNPDLPIYPYLLFLQNFFMTGATIDGTWSLAIEEQFYLTLPLLIRFVPEKPRNILIVIGAVAAPILRTLCFVLFPQRPWFGFFMMPCRADSLLLGVIGALIVRNEKWKSLLKPQLLRIALIVLLLGAVALTAIFKSQTQLPIISIGLTWMAALYLCLIFYSQILRESYVAAFFRQRWLMWMGGIAYGVYLIHDKVLLVIERYNLPVLVCAVVCLLITLCVAKLSWHYFEHPLIRLAHRGEPRYSSGHDPSPDADRTRA